MIKILLSNSDINFAISFACKTHEIRIGKVLVYFQKSSGQQEKKKKKKKK